MASEVRALLTAEIESVCQPLYDQLRPSLLSARELPILCEVVLILRNEVLNGLSEGGDASAPLLRPVHRLVQDAQERITFRVQAFVREQIRGFQPEPEDLAYPRVATPAVSLPAAAAPAVATAAQVEGGGEGGGGVEDVESASA